MNTALTIAGSDSCGGAGIQADIKTMTANGVYAMSAITALTAQNTTGVSDIYEVSPEFLQAQLKAIFEDITPDAVKIGMVSSSDLIKTIAKSLKEYNGKNIVLDPVMVATSGAKLISDDAISTLKEYLIPLATVITPNIPEAEVLSEMEIHNEEEMIKAAAVISEKYDCAVLCKGGHSINDANDLLYRNGEYKWFYGKRINNPNTHGTGCTLSSAIASNLAKGRDLDTSVEKAKEYISGALSAMLDLGKGSGPMNHAFAIKWEQIRAKEVRIVGDEIEPKVYPIFQALKMAEEKELDLVEISPNAQPPVCRIIDYSKFLYQLKKRQKEQKAKQVKVNVKEIRFGPQTDDHDYNFKLKHAKGFLEDGDKVKAYVFFKGRSILFKEQGEVLLLRFANDLEDYAKVDQMPILEGKRMTIQLSPKKKEASKKPATAGTPKPAAPAQKAEMPKTDAE